MGHYPNSTTNRQLFFIVFLVLTTYTTIDLPSIMVQSAGRNSWIPIILASIVFAIVAYMICRLNIINEGKVLFDYGKDIVGKYVSYTISVFYLIYFIMIGVYLKTNFVGLLNSNFLPLTPPYAILITGVPVFGYIAYKGVTNVGRMAEILGILFLGITTLLCVFMLTQGENYGVLPLIDPLKINGIVPTMRDLIVSFGGIEVLFIIPFTAINKKAPKQIFKTIIFIGVFYVLVVESTIVLIGINNSAMLKQSFIEAIKTLELPVIERTDIFYLTFGLASLFAGMVIVYLAIVEFACKIFSKVKRHVLVIIISVLLFILTLLALEITNLDEIATNTLPVIVGIGALVIPAILFTVAMIRKQIARSQDAGEEQS